MTFLETGKTIRELIYNKAIKLIAKVINLTTFREQA